LGAGAGENKIVALERKLHLYGYPTSQTGDPLHENQNTSHFQVLFSMAAYSQTAASENVDAPEIDACRASGLIALKERSPTIKDVELDLDSVRVIKMNSKIGDVDIKAMVLGEASIEKKTSSKAKNLICILGEKGKVLLAVFSDQ
jgi:hypothetical protein